MRDDTKHLLASPANAERLKRSVEQARKRAQYERAMKIGRRIMERYRTAMAILAKR
jgi:PHD/YefM family antitoxin component YafN of YafNO toxin-antitoxin module